MNVTPQSAYHLKPLPLLTHMFNAITRNEEGRILLNKSYKRLEFSTSPFGFAAGFETNLGIVAPPTSPVGGYVYTERGWILHATPG